MKPKQTEGKVKYKKQPNVQQLRAIEAPVSGAVRVSAPPGSGKTFLLTHRYVFLTENGVGPEDILMVCFNKTMADEMLARVLDLAPDLANTAAQSQISTIHAACFRILKEEQNGNARQVAKDWQVKKFVSEAAEELWPDPDNRPGWAEIMAWINTSKMEGLVPQESGAFLVENLGAYHGDKVYKINVRLAAYLKGAKLITFPDMLLMVDVMLQRDSAFRARWQGRFSHVLVDEGQDTSGQAMRILTTLAAPQDNFFIVGDSDQLLYRFTGATPEANLMDGFEQRFPENLTVKLAVNYRSARSVIGTAQKLIANNYSDAGGPYEQEYAKDTQARDGAPEGMEFSFTSHPDAEAEADAVAESIALRLAGHEEDGVVYAGNPGDVFVGARTRAQLAYLEGPLVRRQVPFINIAGGSFWESKHVDTVVAYLRLAHDNGNHAAFERVYNVASAWMTTPWKKSPQYGEYINHRFLGKEFLTACGGDYRNARSAGNRLYKWGPGVSDLTNFVEELELRLGKGPAKVLRFVLDECYVRWLKADEGLTSHDEAENGKVEDLETVVAIAQDYATVGEFLSYVDECVKAAQDAKDRNWDEYVVISTVHRLKGLERPVVYGVGFGEGTKTLPSGETVPAGLLPHTFSLTPPPNFGVLPTGGMGRVEDERCLAFVLVTRAKNEVHLSYPVEYRGAKFGPSRFAYEMGLVRPEIAPDEYAKAEGFEGQDRDDYSDDQDRENYIIDEAWAEDEAEAKLHDTMRKARDEIAADLEWKSRFAEREAEQEREAFASDPDYQENLSRAMVLAGFPAVGRFEDNIYRPSALELAGALPDFEPSLDRGQLILSQQIAEGHVVRVYTTIMVGEIAGGTGEDSIRVVREDAGKDGRSFHFKNEQDWITRRVPKDCDTREKAAAHLAEKVRGHVAQFTRPCPKCGALQVKCKGGKAGFWWKNTSCRCRVEGGW